MVFGTFQRPVYPPKPQSFKMAAITPLVIAISTALVLAPANAVPSTSASSSSSSSSKSALSASSSSSSSSSLAQTPQIVDGSYSYFPYNSQGGYDSGDIYSPTEDMGGYLRDWNHQEWAKLSGRMHQPKCVEIPRNLSLCQNIGYERMMLPNLLGHDSLGEVTQQAGSWVHLVNINCHPDLKVFLCSLFSPVCLDKIIYPCRTLCSSVKASCETRMKAYGFDWPEMLACKQYPEDNDMCIKLINDVKPDNNCSACKHPLTYESLVDHFCRADVVMRVTVKDIKDLYGDSHLVLRKRKKFFKVKKEISRKVARELKVVIKGGASCTCDTVNATQQRYLVMGYKSEDKLLLNFAIFWDKHNKEFKKGIRAIRKRNTCEGIFNELSNSGGRLDPTRPTKLGRRGGKGGKGGKSGRGLKRGKGTRKGGKRTKRPRQKGRKRGGKKPRRSSMKGKTKRKTKSGRKGRTERKVKKGRKWSKGQRRGGLRSTSSAPTRSGLSRSEIEDRALSNFRRASE